MWWNISNLSQLQVIINDMGHPVVKSAAEVSVELLLHDSPNVLVRASRRSRSPILSGGRDPLGRRRAVIPFRRGVESETTKHCSYPDHTTRDQNEHGDKTLGLVIYMYDTCYCMYPLRLRSRPNRLTHAVSESLCIFPARKNRRGYPFLPLVHF